MDSKDPTVEKSGGDPRVELERALLAKGIKLYQSLEQFWADLGYDADEFRALADEPVAGDFDEWLRRERAERRATSTK